MEEKEAVGAMYCERLGDLLQRSDPVMAVSLMPQTQGLIRRRELRLMKPTAILINIRPTVLTKAAALDVTYPESLPRGHPLLELKNVTLTPHRGRATHPTRRTDDGKFG